MIEIIRTVAFAGKREQTDPMAGISQMPQYIVGSGFRTRIQRIGQDLCQKEYVHQRQLIRFRLGPIKSLIKPPWRSREALE